MSFRRVFVHTAELAPTPLRAGDGLIGNVLVHSKTDDADATITFSQLSGGFIQQSGTLTAARTITLPTAAVIIAEWPSMEVGDSFLLVVSNANTAAFAVTVAGGTGITLVGSGSIPRYESRIFALVKTSATAMSLY